MLIEGARVREVIYAPAAVEKRVALDHFASAFVE
jgi:hypothetical protein